MADIEKMVSRGVGSAGGAGTRSWDVTTSDTLGEWVELAPHQKYRRGLDAQNMDDVATVWFVASETQPGNGDQPGALEIEAKTLNVQDFSIQDRWWVRADAPGVLVRVWEY